MNDIKFTEYSSNEVREFIGKRVQYLQEQDIDKSGRGYVFFRYGTIDCVDGRNVVIDGDYKWIPDFRMIQEITGANNG